MRTYMMVFFFMMFAIMFSGCLKEEEVAQSLSSETVAEPVARFQTITSQEEVIRRVLAQNEDAFIREVEGQEGLEVPLYGGGTQLARASRIISADVIKINKGDEFTFNTDVLVNLSFDEGVKMFLSSTSDCSVGEWEDYQKEKKWQIQELNTQNWAYVKFIDLDGAETNCVGDSILHDNSAPIIIVHRRPGETVETGIPVEISFEVKDSESGVKIVYCGLEPARRDCSSNETEFFENLPVGTHTYQIIAQDWLGQERVVNVTWTVIDQYQAMVQEIGILENKKVDILFVVDNSGSMAYEQQSMANRLNNFLYHISDFDWQIAVTTTDPRAITLGDGKLIELKNMPGKYILNSSMDTQVAQSVLGSTIQRSETGYHLEQGILTTYRVIERALENRQSQQGQLIRDDAALAIVLISDEDESAFGFKNLPESLVQLVRNTWNGQKNFSFHSIITRPGDLQCLNGQGARYGHIFKELSDLTGSIVGTVCASDYASQLSGIGMNVKNTQKSVTLNCEPVTGLPISVFKNGQPYLDHFIIEGLKLTFDTNLSQGDYTFYYSCEK